MLVAALAACGDGIGAPDATLPTDTPGGLVRVRVTGPDAQAVRVIFQNADSSLVLSTRTDLEGRANAFMVPGGFVTLAVPDGFQQRLYTWSDVQPGDDLVLGEAFTLPGPLSPSFRVTVPEDPGQEHYALSTTCGAEALDAPQVLTTQVFFSGCAEQHDVLITNSDPSFQNEHYLFLDGVTLAGAVLSLETPFRAFDSARVEVRNVPDHLQDLGVSMMLFDNGFPMQSSLRGRSFSLSGGGGALDLPMMLPAGATVMMSMQSSIFGPAVTGIPHVIRWGPPQSVTSVDLATTALRPYVEQPLYVRAAHALRWAEWSTGAQADAVIAAWGWSDFSRGGNYQWHVFAPRTEDTLVKLPVLPYPDLMPGPNAQLQHPYELTNIKADGGYAKLRTRLPITWTAGRNWPIDSPSGEVVMQQLGGQFD